MKEELSNNLGVLNDNFIIIEKLGEGGYSTVYKVFNSSTNQE